MVDTLKQRRRMMKELRTVEDLISERHMECLIPVYHGISPDSEDIHDSVRYSCALPAGYQTNYINTNDRYLDLIMKKISGACSFL